MVPAPWGDAVSQGELGLPDPPRRAARASSFPIVPERDPALSQWWTPPDLASRMAAWAVDGLRPGARLLEPSAGEGRLVAPLAQMGWGVEAVEIDVRWRPALTLAGAASVEIDDYLRRPAPVEPYDAILTNPPFTRGLEREHLAKMLAEGRRLVALLPSRAMHGSGRYESVWSHVDRGAWYLRRLAYLRRRPVFGDGGGRDELVVVDLRLDPGPCAVEWW